MVNREISSQIVILNINMYTCTRMFINLRILKSRTISAASLLFNHFHQRAKRVEFLPVCRLNEAFEAQNQSLHVKFDQNHIPITLQVCFIHK